MNKQYLHLYIKIVGLLILPILLFFVPIDWLNKQHTVCLFKNIFGVECWGCGITRAVISAVQFHLEEAFFYNKMIVIVFPLLIYEWIKIVKGLFIKLFKVYTTNIKITKLVT